MESDVEGQHWHRPYFETEGGGFILDGWDTGYDPTDPLKGLSEEKRARVVELLGGAPAPAAHWVERAKGSKELIWEREKEFE